MIKMYRKTSAIMAEQFDYEKWVHMRHDAYPMVFGDTAEDGGMMATNPVIPTIEGDMRVHDGDWIATGIDGEHWPISNDVFRKTYAELPAIPDYAADWIEECKQENISLSYMLCSERRPEQIRDWMALTPGTYQFDYARYQKYQELVARAWLDGYRVEAQHDTRTD